MFAIGSMTKGLVSSALGSLAEEQQLGVARTSTLLHSLTHRLSVYTYPIYLALVLNKTTETIYQKMTQGKNRLTKSIIIQKATLIPHSPTPQRTHLRTYICV